MFKKCLVKAIVAGVLFCSPLMAQPAGQDVELLKLQLRQLQNQLDQLASVDAQRSEPKRVTSVGNQSSIRSKRENTLVLRVYDLSDLFTVAPQYPAKYPDDIDLEASRELFPNVLASDSSRGGGLGGGAFNIPPHPQRSLRRDREDKNDPFSNISLVTPQDVVTTGAGINLVSLAEVIMETVSPDEWEENGGDARIAILGNSFVISCYPSMHEKIQELFDLFRKKWGVLRTIAVHAYWCRASVDQITSLVGASQTTDPVDLGRGVSVIDQRKWDEFLAAARTADQIAYAAALTSQNGQTVHTLSGELTSYVSRATPIVKGTERAVVAYDSQIATIQQGAAIQVTPLATRGGNFVMLDVHSRVNEIKSIRKASFSTTSSEDENVNTLSSGMEVPSFIAYRLSTTVRLPKDRVVLVGGMTFDQPSAPDRPELYLFVKATVHDIVMDE